MVVIAHSVSICIKEIVFFDIAIADGVVGCRILNLGDVVGPDEDSRPHEVVYPSVQKRNLHVVPSEHLSWSEHILIHFPVVFGQVKFHLLEICFGHPVVSIQRCEEHLFLINLVVF